ncbi:replicative DNA helicase [Burkholderia pseudomallei]|uniref:replicative DNA helicase n=1 Tax=Burkholderia pseudomallei TaxID=28450 RepID=UPI0005387894|nr:replicative DNA helicase [Burkholderia pseudomallei]KGW26962.1 replicative DNA helicase [Burkholderia pseudomallei MSHR733]KGX47213.1 replicative DNA helicase [Burkholderia pseudomallei MSHR2138]KGX47483.1 replicative DNA helicase [Burkholderia pseudomallei MSHR3709]OMZ07263.1 replicative DNA helicase [Burkholderia pseudomallei]OMZ13153.1 replicative DNA helicase [Burkholderia pseudomallei]
MNAPEQYFEDGGRAVPMAIEMEQSVLGALMIDNDAIDRIGELRAEHFFRFEHRIIFEGITKLIVAGRSADVVMVFEWLSTNGHLDKTGGLPYLNAIVQNTPGAANIARYAEIVVDRAKMRHLIAAADEVAAEVVNRNGKSVNELIAFAQAKFEPLSDGRTEGPKFIGEYLTPVVETIDREYHGNAPTAISTGLSDLDFKLGGGMRGGDLVIIAGRPSMGKTALAMAIGEHVAERHGPALVDSLEMPGTQLAQRAISRQGDIALQRVRNGSKFSDEDWPKLTNVVGRLTELPLLVDETAGMSLPEIVSRARAVKRKHGLKLLVVDYLQLMTGGPDERHDLRIASYSAGLKALAKQLDIPVIALSQLNRALEQRPNKRPTMADLRDSGAIEQDADTILFLYRDEVYHENTPDPGIAEIIIAKQRNGALGTAYAAFIHEQAKFGDLAMGYIPTPRRQPRQQKEEGCE